ncbi:MAG: SpoVA/SpoVAEb family sporulation membrane protein [Bacilli bacterium]|jgi:stage V sporulation protein AC
MDKKMYQDLVKRLSPKENKIYNIMKAFLIGGLLGLFAQFIIDIYLYNNIPQKEANTFMIITLIIIASIWTAIGNFDNLVGFAKAGLIVPITGFAHAMTSSAMEYRKEGLIQGIGSNIFKLSGSVILYGVTAAYVFGLIRILLFGG